MATKGGLPHGHTGHILREAISQSFCVSDNIKVDKAFGSLGVTDNQTIIPTMSTHPNQRIIIR